MKEEEIGSVAYEEENKEEENVEEEHMEKWLVTKEASVAYEHPKDIYSDHLVERPKIRKDEIAQVIKVHCFMLNDKGKVVRIDLGSEKQREQTTFTVKKRKSKSYGVRALIGRKFKKF